MIPGMAALQQVDLPAEAAPWFLAGVEHGRAEALQAAAQQLREVQAAYQTEVEQRAAKLRGKRAQEAARAGYAPFVAVFGQVAGSLEQNAREVGLRAKKALGECLAKKGLLRRVAEAVAGPPRRGR